MKTRLGTLVLYYIMVPDIGKEGCGPYGFIYAKEESTRFGSDTTRERMNSTDISILMERT